MDPTTIKIIAGILALILGVLYFRSRRKRLQR